jgi:hypothetical protein
VNDRKNTQGEPQRTRSPGPGIAPSRPRETDESEDTLNVSRDPFTKKPQTDNSWGMPGRRDLVIELFFFSHFSLLRGVCYVIIFDPLIPFDKTKNFIFSGCQSPSALGVLAVLTYARKP